MMNEDEKKAKLAALLREAEPIKTHDEPSAGGNLIQISGQGITTGQIIAGDMHHYTLERPPKQRVVVTPGEGVVTEEQKSRINALRQEWIVLHNAIKRTPLTDAAAWSRINRKAGVTSYHRIPLERFDDVLGYLRAEMAKLRNMKSAPAKDTEWRNKRIGAIKARCANQLGDPNAYKAYIRKNFGLESLSLLSTDQLQRTYAYIMAKKAPTA